jgi:hypothetical protein
MALQFFFVPRKPEQANIFQGEKIHERWVSVVEPEPQGAGTFGWSWNFWLEPEYRSFGYGSGSAGLINKDKNSYNIGCNM